MTLNMLYAEHVENTLTSDSTFKIVHLNDPGLL